MPTAKSASARSAGAEQHAEQTPTWNAERLDELSARVDALEERVTGVLSGKSAEISQEEKDRRTLSRRPNSYPEAVEYEAAQKRQAERDKGQPKGEESEDPETASPSSPPSSQPFQPAGA